MGLSSAYLGMRLAVRGTEVEVPSITGKPVGEATEILERVHLKREVMGERFDPEIPQRRRYLSAPSTGENHQGGKECSNHIEPGNENASRSRSERISLKGGTIDGFRRRIRIGKYQ